MQEKVFSIHRFRQNMYPIGDTYEMFKYNTQKFGWDWFKTCKDKEVSWCKKNGYKIHSTWVTHPSILSQIKRLVIK